MAENNSSRREFLKKSIISSLALTYVGGVQSCSKSDSDEYTGEIPTALLGNTGVRIPRISLGLGSRFCSIADEEIALDILNYALDNGLYSWDTAHSYQGPGNVISEERLGKVLKYRRDEVFISTKIGNRNPVVAMQQIELSLKRLQTDYIDNLMIHNVDSITDVDLLSKNDGIIDLFISLRDQGLARFIGFSGHGNAQAMEAILDRGNFDTMLIAMDQHTADSQREDLVIPKALEKNIGVLLMKVVRPKETVSGVNATELIRYALSIEGPTGIVLGMDSLEVVKSNIEILRSFEPINSNDQARIASALAPAIINRDFEWMKEGYRDRYGC